MPDASFHRLPIQCHSWLQLQLHMYTLREKAAALELRDIYVLQRSEACELEVSFRLRPRKPTYTMALSSVTAHPFDTPQAVSHASLQYESHFTGTTRIPPQSWWRIPDFVTSAETLALSIFLAWAQSEIVPCRRALSKSGRPMLDINTLCRQHLLRSICTETLRLRVAAIVTRTPSEDGVQLGKTRSWASRPCHSPAQVCNSCQDLRVQR
jgi:hypothetical protein